MPFVYLIVPSLCPFIKLGKWKTSISALKGRYITYYGKYLKIFAYPVGEGDEYSRIEKILKHKLYEYLIDPKCELLKSQYLEHYKSVFKSTCGVDHVKCVTAKNTKYKCVTQYVNRHIIHQRLLKTFNINKLSELEDTIISNEKLMSILPELESIIELSKQRKIYRQDRSTNKEENLRIFRCIVSLSSVLKVFGLNFYKHKRQRIRIGGRQVDNSSYCFKYEHSMTYKNNHCLKM